MTRTDVTCRHAGSCGHPVGAAPDAAVCRNEIAGLSCSDVPAFRVGRRLRVKRSDFDHFIDGCYLGPAAPSARNGRGAIASRLDELRASEIKRVESQPWRAHVGPIAFLVCRARTSTWTGRLSELDDWTNAHCADPYDEPYLDADLNPITPEQLLEHIRELEGETGEQMIFRHDERPGRAA